MNKKLKKGLTVSSAAAMGMSIVLPTVSVIAAPAVTNGWVNQNGTWYYYNNGTLVKNGWAKDSKGWCFLSAVDGSWVQNGWAKDSHGWGYIQNGYWVEHETWAQDSAGWNHINADGYWDGKAALPYNPLADAAVTGVSATNATTLTITGTNLNKLAVADVTVAGNTVTSVTANADGTSATVILGSNLVADTATAVTVKGTSYSVTFSLSATTVAVTAATFDNNTTNQFVAVSVNGAATTVANLRAAGYNVTFNAYSDKTGATPLVGFFADQSTGELAGSIDAILAGSATSTGASAYISVTITKDAYQIVSPLQKCTVRNMDYAANSITSYTLSDVNAGYVIPVTNTAPAAGTLNFDLNSSNLVVGETATVSKIKVNTGNSTETDYIGYSLDTSNAGVVSVDKGVLTANTPGSATITITYGGVTRSFNVTVNNDTRKLKSVVAEDTNGNVINSVSVIAGKTKDIQLVPTDQYGDPMILAGGSNVVLSTPNPLIVTLAPVTLTKTATVTVNAVAKGTATLTYTDNNGITVNGALPITISDNTTVTSSRIVVNVPASNTDAAAIVAGKTTDDFSTDNTLDLSNDAYIVYNINNYNSDGTKVATVPFVGAGPSAVDITASVAAQSAVGVVTIGAAAANGNIVVQAAKTGTATITIKDNNTGLSYTEYITVVNQKAGINSVSFKAPVKPVYGITYDDTSVLNLTTGNGADAKVSGVSLKTSSSYPVRINTAGAFDRLYLDKNGDGTYTDETTDTTIGFFEISSVGLGTNATNAKTCTVLPSDSGTVIFKVVGADSTGAIDQTNVISSTSVTF